MSTEQDAQGAPGEGQPQPVFDPNAPHQVTPKLRSIQGFGAKHPSGAPMLGLRDARQLSEQIVFTAPLAQFLLPSMDGNNTVTQIVDAAAAAATEKGAPPEAISAITEEAAQNLIAQLDNACLLEGPTFDALWRKLRDDFDSSDILPPGPTADVADGLVMQEHGQDATEAQKNDFGPQKLRDIIETWCNTALEKAEKPSFDTLPKAVIVPHTDYNRGWINYAHIYGRMRVTDTPDRVIILGMNHHGQAHGVCGCDKGYRTPLGTCAFDNEFDARLRRHLGEGDTEKLYADRYDHEREHSIEVQLPWVQHVFGPAELPASDDTTAYPKVYAALMYDVLRNTGEPYSEAGLSADPFLKALKAAIDESEGTTLVIATAELSHVGPAFGDQQPVGGDSPEAKEFRERAVKQDRDLLQLAVDGKAEEIMPSIAWAGNWSRWAGMSSIQAALGATGAEKITLLNYAAAADQQGMSMVSSFAAIVQ